MTTARDVMDAAVTEAQFQRQLVRQLREWGWWVWHNTIAYRSAPGWPDLFCLRENRAVAIECKTVKGKLSAAQEDVMERLAAAGIDCYVFRPGEWERITKAMFA